MKGKLRVFALLAAPAALTACGGSEDGVPEVQRVPETHPPMEAPAVPGVYLSDEVVSACAAVGPDDLPTDAVLTAGSFRVHFIAEGRGVEGRLELGPGESPEGRILVGHTDLELNAVGAVTQGSAASTEAGAPGVAVFLLSPAPGEEGPRILLRFGAELNRDDRRPVEGATTVARVHRIRDDGFDALWESRGFNLRLQGHLCAWREG